MFYIAGSCGKMHPDGRVEVDWPAAFLLNWKTYSCLTVVVVALGYSVIQAGMGAARVPWVRSVRHVLSRPPWRTLVLLVAVLGVLALAFRCWTPGRVVTSGWHDRGTNGIWMQHGWLGDDEWFSRYKKDPLRFREVSKIQSAAQSLAAHGIRDVFPHLCPCEPNGRIAMSDPAQVERFLDGFEGFRVMAWIGGVLGAHCSPSSADWRREFVSSAVDLLRRHPRLAGVQVNIEPLPSNEEGYLELLEELKKAIPEGRVLSVAAYPPPTLWHRFPEVHWDELWFRAVASRCDHLAVMAYDTGLRVPKLYEHLMAGWTAECLAWAGTTPVLMGVPAYDDADSGYHDPAVENLHHALAGIHGGLPSDARPANFLGVAIYCEWEMNSEKWKAMESEFCRHK